MIAASLSHIPVVKEVVPRTRRARVMFRSVIVAFALIALWIGTIVWLQLRGGIKPDFRPQIESILIQLRDGHSHEVYDQSSTRFQEMVIEDTFVEQVDLMRRDLGAFLEIASVIKTDTYEGASGETARVEFLLEFEHGRARGSMSFHHEEGQWRMVGFGIDLPPEV